MFRAYNRFNAEEHRAKIRERNAKKKSAEQRKKERSLSPDRRARLLKIRSREEKKRRTRVTNSSSAPNLLTKLPPESSLSKPVSQSPSSPEPVPSLDLKPEQRRRKEIRDFRSPMAHNPKRRNEWSRLIDHELVNQNAEVLAAEAAHRKEAREHRQFLQKQMRENEKRRARERRSELELKRKMDAEISMVTHAEHFLLKQQAARAAELRAAQQRRIEEVEARRAEEAARVAAAERAELKHALEKAAGVREEELRKRQLQNDFSREQHRAAMAQLKEKEKERKAQRERDKKAEQEFFIISAKKTSVAEKAGRERLERNQARAARAVRRDKQQRRRRREKARRRQLRYERSVQREQYERAQAAAARNAAQRDSLLQGLRSQIDHKQRVAEEGKESDRRLFQQCQQEMATIKFANDVNSKIAQQKQEVYQRSLRKQILHNRRHKGVGQTELNAPMSERQRAYNKALLSTLPAATPPGMAPSPIVKPVRRTGKRFQPDQRIGNRQTRFVVGVPWGTDLGADDGRSEWGTGRTVNSHPHTVSVRSPRARVEAPVKPPWVVDSEPYKPYAKNRETATAMKEAVQGHVSENTRAKVSWFEDNGASGAARDR